MEILWNSLSGDIVVHESVAAEQREAARRAHHASDHVFGGLLKPMSNGVFEFLVPYL